MASSVRGAAFRTKPFICGDVFDRIEVGRVFWQEQEAGSDIPDRLAHRFSFMGGKVVEDDNVVGFEGWDEKLLDIGAKALAVDWTVEHAGRLDAVVTQRGEGARGP